MRSWGVFWDLADKDTRHNYTLTYDWLLSPYQTSATHVLEVGVKKGGSIKLWREFFNAGATIVGVDVDKAVPTFPRDAHIKTVLADSTNWLHVCMCTTAGPLACVYVYYSRTYYSTNRNSKR